MPKATPARSAEARRRADRRDPTDGRGTPNKSRNAARRKKTAAAAGRKPNPARKPARKTAAGRSRGDDGDHEYR
jgi:hypothetical protein